MKEGVDAARGTSSLPHPELTMSPRGIQIPYITILRRRCKNKFTKPLNFVTTREK